MPTTTHPDNRTISGCGPYRTTFSRLSFDEMAVLGDTSQLAALKQLYATLQALDLDRLDYVAMKYLILLQPGACQYFDIVC